MAVFLLGAVVSLSCAAKASDALAAPGSATEVNKTAAWGERFTLRVGESASIEASLLVGFIGVSADSRCPKGDQCVWAGDATVQIWIQPKGGEREERKISASGREPAPTRGSSYEVRLVRLDPQPVSGRSIERGDYVATLQVLREAALSIR